MNYRSVLIVALAALATASSPALAQPRFLEVSNERFIEVGGEASVNVTPDFAYVTLGVTSTAKDASEAMAANAKSVSALISAIKAEGVAPADIQTSSLSISPQFSNPAPNAAEAREITGYVVSDMVTVTARDLSRLGGLLDKAVQAGANSMYGIAYGENNPQALLDKVRPLAVADARRKAEIYANAGGAKVGRLMTLTEQGGAAPVQFARQAYMESPSAPTPIEVGHDKLTIAITAQFELTQ